MLHRKVICCHLPLIKLEFPCDSCSQKWFVFSSQARTMISNYMFVSCFCPQLPCKFLEVICCLCFIHHHIPSTKHICVFMKVIRKGRREERKFRVPPSTFSSIKIFQTILCFWKLTVKVGSTPHTHSHSTVLIFQWPKHVCSSTSISLKHLLATGEKKQLSEVSCDI